MRARFGLSLKDQCLSTLKPCVRLVLFGVLVVVWFVVWSRMMSKRSETLARASRGLLGCSSTELALSRSRKLSDGRV